MVISPKFFIRTSIIYILYNRNHPASTVFNNVGLYSAINETKITLFTNIIFH